MNKSSSRTLQQLEILVRRLEKDRRYMAWALASYQRQERLSENKLLEKLQATREMLFRLALCAYPNTESQEFHNQIKQISFYTNINGYLIANIVRQVESLDVLSYKSKKEMTDNHVIEKPGIFAAARDNDSVTDSDELSPADDLQNDDEDGNAAG
jgi:hypothetical protein